MAEKRDAEASGGPPKKKGQRQISFSTFKQWQTKYDREYQSLSWLRCTPDPQDSSLVYMLTCSVCQKYESSICSLRNFSSAWITGSVNHRTSNFTDHAQSDQHKTAMMKLRTDQARASSESITSYSSIARCLLRMDETVKDQLRKKFDICYVMAKEKVAFRKYPALYALETRHGVNLGEAYKTKDSAKNFTHFIADTHSQMLTSTVSSWMDQLMQAM